jgi:hypothetical protein
MPTYLILFIGRLLAVGNLEFCNLRLLLAGRPFHITWRIRTRIVAMTHIKNALGFFTKKDVPASPKAPQILEIRS